MGCMIVDILVCFNFNLYIFLRFVCVLFNFKCLVLDILIKCILVSILFNNLLKFVILDCVLVDIFCIICFKGMMIKINIGIVINVNKVNF